MIHGNGRAAMRICHMRRLRLWQSRGRACGWLAKVKVAVAPGAGPGAGRYIVCNFGEMLLSVRDARPVRDRGSVAGVPLRTLKCPVTVCRVLHCQVYVLA